MSFFFGSKKKILPLLKDCVDIHCHVLPALDDGAKTFDETAQMLGAYAEIGFKKIIATPHILKGTYPNTSETISTRFQEISKKEGTELIYSAAAEYMLDEDFEIYLEKGELLKLQENYVLIEMSYFQPPANLQSLIFKMVHNGFQPVLAHPERYNFIRKKENFRELKSMGCSFQLNLLSLSKHYGDIVQKKAFTLLQNGFYDFIGTDAHHLRHLQEIKEISVSKQVFEKVERLAENNMDVFM